MLDIAGMHYRIGIMRYKPEVRLLLESTPLDELARSLGVSEGVPGLRLSSVGAERNFMIYAQDNSEGELKPRDVMYASNPEESYTLQDGYTIVNICYELLRQSTIDSHDS